jgi:hypothetical protein
LQIRQLARFGLLDYGARYFAGAHGLIDLSLEAGVNERRGHDVEHNGADGGGGGVGTAEAVGNG